MGKGGRDMHGVASLPNSDSLSQGALLYLSLVPDISVSLRVIPFCVRLSGCLIFVIQRPTSETA